MSDPLVAVEIGVCPCPGTPHPDGDTVYLHPKASLRMGFAINGAIAGGDNDPVRVAELMGVAYLRLGIASWTFTERDGRERDVPVPLTEANIERLLPWGEGGAIVADRADRLYSEAVLAPLVARSAAMSSTGRSNGSISAIPSSGPKRRNSSRSRSPEHSEDTSGS